MEEERRRIEEENKRREEEKRRQEESSAGARYDLPPDEYEEENLYENVSGLVRVNINFSLTLLPQDEAEQARDSGSITAVALYDYQAMAEDEISFDPNDIITNIEMVRLYSCGTLTSQL